LGLTPAVHSRLGLEGGGIWIDEPHRVLAFGVAYFLAQGLWGICLPVLFLGPRSRESILIR
ncbi:MAG: hypothetical protein FD129_941, partial [bacterium]